MYPAFVLFRGPGLDQPVLLRHANVVNANLGKDPLAIVYGSLRPVSIESSALNMRRYLEVAEFFGPEWTEAINPADGIPTRELQFEKATHFSRVYLAAGEAPPVWDNPVVAPAGASYPYFQIGPTGRAVLDSLGIRLTS
jgi:hypothetical protein